MKELEYTVMKDAINPTTICDGGMQGEDNAVKIVFNLDSSFTGAVNDAINLYSPGTKAKYRLDVTKGDGSYYSVTSPEGGLVLTYNGETPIKAEYSLPDAVTLVGGFCVIYLAVEILSPENNAVKLIFSKPAKISFTATSNGSSSQTAYVNSIFGAVEQAVKFAADASSSAIEARYSALDAKAFADSGQLHDGQLVISAKEYLESDAAHGGEFDGVRKLYQNVVSLASAASDAATTANDRAVTASNAAANAKTFAEGGFLNDGTVPISAREYLENDTANGNEFDGVRKLYQNVVTLIDGLDGEVSEAVETLSDGTTTTISGGKIHVTGIQDSSGTHVLNYDNISAKQNALTAGQLSNIEKVNNIQVFQHTGVLDLMQPLEDGIHMHYGTLLNFPPDLTPDNPSSHNCRIDSQAVIGPDTQCWKLTLYASNLEIYDGVLNDELGNIDLSWTKRDNVNTKQSKVISDTKNYFTTNTVEGALEELASNYTSNSTQIKTLEQTRLKDYYKKRSILETFSLLGDWTNPDTANGTISEDTVNSLTGTRGIKFTVNTPGSTAVAERTINVKLPTSTDFKFRFYLHEAPANLLYIGVILTSSSATYTQTSAASTAPLYGAKLQQGYNTVVLQSSNFTSSDPDIFTKTLTKLRLTVVAKTGCTCNVTFDSLEYNTETQGMVVLTFDDGRASQYTEVFPRLRDAGLPATFYIAPDLINKSYYMTESQLKEIYDTGLFSFGNHTMTHNIDIRSKSKAEITQEFTLARDWFLEKGYTRGIEHGAVPNGYYSDTIKQAMIDAGLKSQRGGVEGAFYSPVHDRYNLQSLVVQSGVHDLSAVITKINSAITSGQTIILTFHSIADTPVDAYQWQTSYFAGLVDYLVKSGVPVVSVDDYYAGLNNAKYQ